MSILLKKGENMNKVEQMKNVFGGIGSHPGEKEKEDKSDRVKVK